MAGVRYAPPAVAPAFSMVGLATRVGIAAATGVDRTCGWSLFYGDDTKIRGLRARLLYSGSGTDAWDLSVWLNGAASPSKRAAIGITANGLYTVAFTTPLDVAALDDVVIGMRCASAQRVVQAAASGSSSGATWHFSTAATPRVNHPFWTGSHTITSAALYSTGDARPATDTFASYGACFPLEPYTSVDSAARPGDAVLAFGGDSVTYGSLLADPPAQRFATLVAAQLGLRTVALDAVPGYRLDQLTARWSAYMDPGVHARDPGAVLVMQGGYNDFAAGATDATIRSRFAAYVAASRASGVRRVVYLGCYAAPLSSALAGIDYEARRTAHNAWVEASGLVDAMVSFDGATIDVAPAPDGLHPTAAGHATIAGLVTTAIRSVL